MKSNNTMEELQIKQLKLDEFIIKKHKLEKQDLFGNKVIALDVELSEFMNNIESFKHWKKNKGKPNVLEEGCDCLHFIFSLSNDLNYELNIPFSPNISNHTLNSKNDCINQLYANAKRILWKDIAECKNSKGLDQILWILVRALKHCDYSWEELIKEYDKKYEINIQRQNEGY